MTNMRRVLGALAAGAIALPFVASPAAAGDTPIPDLRSIATFCENPTASPFTDVQATGDANAVELALAVRCIATAGITQGGPQGLPATQYGPLLNVTRGQMASFIARTIDAADARESTGDPIRALPAPAAGNPFPGDVPNNYVHLNNIKRLVQAGIVAGNPGTAAQPNGIGADKYGPDLFVTRAQMASFINRAVAYMTGDNPAQAGTGGNGFVAPAGAHYYADALPAVHAANINGITAAGISNGTGNDRYTALANVTRQQMARFLARTLATLFETAGEQRILGLNNAFSAAFGDADRASATRLATATPLESSDVSADRLNARTYTATGLAAGVEYRITLVTAGAVLDGNPGDVRFATRPDTGQNGLFLVNTGITSATSQAVITSVNGATPMNNSAAGETTTTATASATAVAFVAADGTLTFEIIGAQGQEIIPVIYRNGAGNQSSYTTGGGARAPLEVDADGRPVEFFGLAGRTAFVPPAVP